MLSTCHDLHLLCIYTNITNLVLFDLPTQVSAYLFDTKNTLIVAAQTMIASFLLFTSIALHSLCKRNTSHLWFYSWSSSTNDVIKSNLEISPIFSIFIKCAWPDHFFDHPTYLNFFEILVPIDGSYFSHSHPEIWRSTIRYLRRNNQKRVK